jgi:ketosteroid isomerase-like protein
MSEADFELVRRFNGLFRTRDVAALDELLAPEFVAHNGDEDVHGPEGWRRFLEEAWERFERIDTGVQELLTDGTLVAERWTFHASGGDGPELHGHGITVHRIVDGRMRENWAVFHPDDPQDADG